MLEFKPVTEHILRLELRVRLLGPISVPVARDLERGQPADGMAVIHLPGHSPGQVGFLHPEGQAMICGDAAFNLGGSSRFHISLAGESYG